MTYPNQIYTIDPEVIKSFEDFVQIIREFGFYQARFIAIIPGGWKSKVIKHIADIYSDNPKLKNDYVVRARRLLGRADAGPDENKEQFCIKPLDFRQNINDIENIYVAAFKRKHVHKCISTDGAEGTICFTDYKLGDINLELKNSDTIRDVSDEVSINRQLKLFMPLIEFNGDISIIDPYLDLRKNFYVSLIEKIIIEISNQVYGISESKSLNIYFATIEKPRYEKSQKLPPKQIMTEDDLNEVKAEWLKKYKKIIDNGLTINLYPMIHHHQDLHDRWVLGNLAGGWLATRGAKAQKRNEELTYKAMTNDEVNEKLNDYNLNNNRIKLDFGLKEPIVITKISN